MSTKGTKSAQKALRWRGPARSKETDETGFKLSKCKEEFSGLEKTSGKSFGHHGRIFTPVVLSAFFCQVRIVEGF